MSRGRVYKMVFVKDVLDPVFTLDHVCIGAYKPPIRLGAQGDLQLVTSPRVSHSYICAYISVVEEVANK